MHKETHRGCTISFNPTPVAIALATMLQSGAVAALADDLPLFSAHLKRAAPEPAKASPLLEALAAINPDELTAREALDLVYRLRGMIDGKG